MKEVFILSDYTQISKELTKQLEFTENRIISLPSSENKSDLHDWTTQLFKNNTISKLVIPISIPTDNPINTEGLKMVLHIRLNYEITLSQRLIPIILLSDFSIENIICKNNFDTDNNPQSLLFTKGIYLSSFDSAEIIKTVKNAEPCSPEDYQKQVLNRLKILPKASTRIHSITNAWGCFKLAQVTGLRDEIFKHVALSGYLKELYSKYLICYNDAFTQEKRIDHNPIKCNSKKILFIDDQADEGWGDLMKNIFKGAGNNFVFIDSAKYKNSETKLFHDFEGFLTECRSHIGNDWDLVIIDLRLNPEKEDVDNEMVSPTEFSGYNLINEFLTENEGYQIIVSTASNKIWNINAALKRGASSFYVKESPEFNYSIKETNRHYENFKKDISHCFEKKYLSNIWKCINKIKKHFANNPLKKYFPNNLEMLKALSYQNLILEEVDSSFGMLKTENENKFNVVMLSLFKVLESLSEIFIEKDETNGKLKFWDGSDVMFCKYNNRKYDLIQKNREIPKYAYESTENKVHALLFQKLIIEDFNLHQVIHNISKYRNDYIHPENRFNLSNLTSNDIENWVTTLEKILIKV